MKEADVQKAVEAARGYLDHNHGLGYFELKNLCRAIIALDEDCVEDEDEEDDIFIGQPTNEVAQQMLNRHVLGDGPYTIQDDELRVLYDEQTAKLETAAAAMVDFRLEQAAAIARAWPPWQRQDPEPRRYRLAAIWATFRRFFGGQP